MVEQLWFVLVALFILHVMQWLLIGWVLIRLGQLEVRCQALQDPDEFENMLADLEAVRRHRLGQVMNRVPPSDLARRWVRDGWVRKRNG